jgi:3-oxoacyl-[acyl-carrier-protein] synthase-3
MLDIGSGGSACVLRKDAGRNVILGSAFKGDGSLSLDCIVPTLGTKAWPPREGDLEKAHFVVADEPVFKAKLGEKTMPNFYWVIDRALDLSGGLSRRDLGYLAVLHFKKSAHDAILAELGIGDGQTTYLDDYGHVGQNDQLISIELGLAAGKIHDGDNLVLVGAGLGFVWAASVVRWGPYKE